MDPKTLKVGDIITGTGCHKANVLRITKIDLDSANSPINIAYDILYPDTLEVYSNSSCSCTGSFSSIKLINPTKQNNGGLFKMLNQMMKKLLDADTQALIKAGYVNGDLLLTTKGQEVLTSVLFFANKKDLVTIANEEIAEQEKNKN